MSKEGQGRLGTDFCVLERVPEYRPCNMADDGSNFVIIDLETTGLDYKKDKITEIGLVKISTKMEASAPKVKVVYQAFNDPGIPITKEINKLTGITDELVKGQAPDWNYIEKVLRNVDFIVCHNASFDRKFLEQTPLRYVFTEKVLACSKNDIDWKRREYGAAKLDYLNWKLGYFYDAHRAINDCWATLNLLTQEEGALEELIDNTKDVYEIYAISAPYEVKDTLKQAGFFWNPGDNGKPRAWFKEVKDTEETVKFLQDNSLATPKIIKIPANRKYSSEV